MAFSGDDGREKHNDAISPDLVESQLRALEGKPSPRVVEAVLSRLKETRHRQRFLEPAMADLRVALDHMGDLLGRFSSFPMVRIGKIEAPADPTYQNKSGFQFGFTGAVSKSRARNYFSKIWTEVVNMRLSAPSAGVLSVTIDSQQSHWRVHYSYAYLIAPVYFGAPTHPVTGQLRTGVYFFAGDCVGTPLRWDAARCHVTYGSNHFAMTAF